MIHFDLPKEKSSIIKVIGIGGGGSNAVNFMFNQGIEGVDFIICNTDSQAMANSAVPNKVQLGPHLTQGLGAGANPNIGKQATEESFEEIKKILEVNTKMAFITAGMGGGTGTGGAPIIAKICNELGILTVGIVTTPFSYEGKRRMLQADEGIKTLKDYVDTLLVISNDKLRQQFGNLPFKAAFAKADNILATAAKCITDVINIHGIVNVDFADVCTAMRNGGVAILGSATAEGENRAQKAIEEALASPLLNDNNIRGAQWILLNITSSEGEFEHTIDEMDIIQAFIQQQAGEDCDVILGMGHDNDLGSKLGVTIIATGFEQRPIGISKNTVESKKEPEKILMTLGIQGEEKKAYDANTGELAIPLNPMAPSLVESEEETPLMPDRLLARNKEEDAGRQVSDLQPGNSLKPQDKMQESPEPKTVSGGYLAKPRKIYAEPAQPEQASLFDFSEPQPQDQGMSLIFKDEEEIQHTSSEEHHAAASDFTEPVAQLEETEEQKRIAAERITRLRNISFNVKGMENGQELESVPAYIRRNIALDDKQGSQEDPFSPYTVQKPDDGRQAEISTINTFLDGKKPD